MTSPPDPFRTRPIGVGPLRFEVESEEPEVVERLDHLFAGFPSPQPRASPVRIVLQRRAAGSDLFDSTVDGAVLAEAMALSDQEFRLTRLFNDRKLDAEPEFLHLHSAAVAKRGRAVLLVARSGLGKSSLTAALVRSGWEYLTDEMVALSVPGGLVTGYPRPITLRAGTWPSFPELGPYPAAEPESRGGARVEVSPLDLGTVADETPLEVVAVVVPRFTDADAAGPHAIATAAEAVERMVSCCYDLERLGAAGAAVLVDLAARGAAWQLDYVDLAEAVVRFDELVEAAASTPRLTVVHSAPTPVVGPLSAGTVHRSREAHAWLFSDGSAVVFDPSRLALSRLDRAGFGLWEALADPCTPEALARSVGAASGESRASLMRWVEMMAQVGLLETSA